MSFWENWQKKREDAGILKDQSLNTLNLFLTNGNTQGRPCDIYLGYITDSDGLFEKFMPIAMDTIGMLLKNKFVYTHIYPEIILPYSSQKNKRKQGFGISFAESYINKLQAFEHSNVGYFYNGTSSLITSTIGIDNSTLNCLYTSSFTIGTENYIYGFSKKPPIKIDDYSSIANYLDENKHDILLSYHRFHVGLDIQINSNSTSTKDIIDTILLICDRYNEVLNQTI